MCVCVCWKIGINPLVILMLQVLLSFTSSVITLLAAVYTLAESIERISPHPEVHANHLVTPLHPNPLYTLPSHMNQ